MPSGYWVAQKQDNGLFPIIVGGPYPTLISVARMWPQAFAANQTEFVIMESK